MEAFKAYKALGGFEAEKPIPLREQLRRIDNRMAQVLKVQQQQQQQQQQHGSSSGSRAGHDLFHNEVPGSFGAEWPDVTPDELGVSDDEGDGDDREQQQEQQEQQEQQQQQDQPPDEQQQQQQHTDGGTQPVGSSCRSGRVPGATSIPQQHGRREQQGLGLGGMQEQQGGSTGAAPTIFYTPGGGRHTAASLLEKLTPEVSY